MLDPIQLLISFLQSHGVTLPIFNWNWGLKEKGKNRLCGDDELDMKIITPKKKKVPPQELNK